jgi:hypothetical protein
MVHWLIARRTRWWTIYVGRPANSKGLDVPIAATVRRMVIGAGVVLAAAGCGWFTSTASPETLGGRAVAVAERLDAEPLRGPRFEVTVTDVKLDRPYVTVGAVRAHRGPQETVAELVAVLEADGFEVVRNEPVDYSLGHEVLATGDRLVVRAFVGAGSEQVAAYPPLEDGSYLTVSVANVDSGPEWTAVGR